MRDFLIIALGLTLIAAIWAAYPGPTQVADTVTCPGPDCHFDYIRPVR